MGIGAGRVRFRHHICSLYVLAKERNRDDFGSTLPKAALEAVGRTDYFEVIVEDGRLVLTPVSLRRADAVRRKLEEIGITEDDVTAAVEWARQR